MSSATPGACSRRPEKPLFNREHEAPGFLFMLFTIHSPLINTIMSMKNKAAKAARINFLSVPHATVTTTASGAPIAALSDPTESADPLKPVFVALQRDTTDPVEAVAAAETIAEDTLTTKPVEATDPVEPAAVFEANTEDTPVPEPIKMTDPVEAVVAAEAIAEESPNQSSTAPADPVSDAEASPGALAAPASNYDLLGDDVARSVVGVETDTQAAAPSEPVIMDLDLSLIDPNPFNRKDSVEYNLQELADSIAQHGLQSEIKVRPMNGGRYEIVFGERRYRASLLAGLKTIRAKVEEMTDEQAESVAIIENIQRENCTPFEEGEIFCRKMEKDGMSVAGLCLLIGKSEAYVRTRINLTRLIPEVAEMLRSQMISLEIAREFSNYNKKIQKEVYSEHFKEAGSFNSWVGLPAKEFAKRLRNRYLTSLDNYHFDKTDCMACGHNTLNQVLFSLCGDCASCQRPSCLQKKNEAYLIEQCVDLVTKDPRLHLATNNDSNANVVKRLTEQGHEVEELDRPFWHFNRGPKMPESPKAEEFTDADDLAIAQEEHEAAMQKFKEACTQIENEVSEGRMRKFAIIGANDIDIRYEPVRTQTDSESYVMQEPDDPAKDLRKKDQRNHEICYEHITRDLKEVLRSESEKQFPTTNLRPRERQLFYYVVMDRLRYVHEELLGLSGYADAADRLRIAETLTTEQKTMLMRMAIMRYMDDVNENRCDPESTDVKLLTEFAMMHFPEKTKPVVERHQNIYAKRHYNLGVRITNIEQQAEVVRVQSMFEGGALCRTPEGEVINIYSGEVIDENMVEMALSEVDVPDLPVEEPLPCDDPEPFIPVVPDIEEQEDDEPLNPLELIPEDGEILPEPLPTPGASKKKAKAKAKKTAGGKRLTLTPKPEKLAA